MVLSAPLSWRFPPGLNRCRTVRPEEAGSGAVPFAAAHALRLG